MAKLVLSTEGKVIEEYPIKKERLFIGRTKDNDIPIDSMAVSGKHVTILTILDDVFLEDLGSTNGTFLNTKKVFQSPLENGDVITIGTHNIKYLSEDKTKSSINHPKVNGHGKINGDAPHLQVLDGKENGKEIPLTMKLTTLGHPGEHVAAISQRKDGFFFAHVDGGDKGTDSILNGGTVPAGGKQLEDHDIIEVAGIKMEFVKA